jgi:hypothetical protein
VKILLQDKRYRGVGFGTKVGETRKEIFAQKIVLAAGSRAFSDYFETHAKVRRSNFVSLTRAWS